MSAELAKLIYIWNESKDLEDDLTHAASISIDEKKLQTHARKRLHILSAYCKRHLARIFPGGLRVDSSNYCPMSSWLSGAQIVALNMQTACNSCWRNQGMFQGNGMSGYRLKPEAVRNLHSRPLEELIPDATLEITVISGHYLPGHCKGHHGIVSPNVTVTLAGLHPGHFPEKCTTSVESPYVLENGFNPRWDFKASFDVCTATPNIIQFEVMHKHNSEWLNSGMASSLRMSFEGSEHSPLLGQYSIHLEDVLHGYRRVPLLNEFEERLFGPYLFVHTQIIPRCRDS